MNDVRVSYFEKYMREIKDKQDKKGGKAVFYDIGCGGGICTEELARRGNLNSY